MTSANAFYAQSGGVTAVINATASSLIKQARLNRRHIKTVFAGKNGILGALNEELIDTKTLSSADLRLLEQTPGGVFGSCRYKLRSFQENPKDYQRLIDVFTVHNIRYFFYNGGGDSMDTAHKISQVSQKLGWPLQCIGIPKTIDNDLPLTDCCPGFGSVAKYIAVSTQEAALDVKSMAQSSTKVFILEVMGRHAGWIAAASGLAAKSTQDAPHIILLPEIAFDRGRFLDKVKQTVKKCGFCVIVASEGVRDAQGRFLAEQGSRDAFGHHQLGGIAPTLAEIIKQTLGYKYHWAVADYLQRSARHIASQVDFEQALAMGKAAVDFAVQGKNAVMPVIIRKSDAPYRWSIGEVSLKKVANQEKTMPKNFIRRDGFHITAKCQKYLLPLIQGEAYPKYHQGLPRYLGFKPTLTKKKLPSDPHACSD